MTRILYGICPSIGVCNFELVQGLGFRTDNGSEFALGLERVIPLARRA
jgi:hypothetical protein